MKEEQLRDALNGLGGDCEEGADFSLDDVSGDHVWNNLNNSYFNRNSNANARKGPKAASTPFVKNFKSDSEADSVPHL